MDFGEFSADGREYILKKLETPRLWHNHIANDEYCVSLTQTGQGFSFYRAPHAFKVTYTSDTNYAPTEPDTGRFLYLHDHGDGSSWHVNPQLGEPADGFSCRYGLGYSVIEAKRGGIKSRYRVFVPTRDPVELWTVELVNQSGRERQLTLFSYLEWYLTSFPATYTDPKVYLTGRFNRARNTILTVNHNPECIIHYGGFMTADKRVTGYDCSKTSFLGTIGDIRAPQAVQAGRCLDTEGDAERMVGVLSHRFKLKPGEKYRLNIMVGVATTFNQVGGFRKKYLAPGAVERELRKVKRYWKNITGRAEVHTPDAGFDLFFNIWLKYQIHLVKRFTRGLDRGYRDVLQDTRAFMPLDAPSTRHLLIGTLKHQYQDGSAMRQWSEIGGPHDLRNYKDSPSWIPDTLVAYVQETGDADILEEEVPFFDGGAASVYEHALRAVRNLYDARGAHHMCLMGHGDWNDALNQIGRQGRGESVWLTTAACYALLKMEALAKYLGDEPVAREMRAKYEQLKRDINKYAWDGDWYVYAFDDEGRPVGSCANKLGKIHLNVQSWAVFTGVAEGERLRKTLATIDSLDTEIGPVLLKPAYSGYDPRIGRITGMVPGAFENGAVYSHGVGFKFKADGAARRPEVALETFRKILPINPKNPPERSTLEPFGLTNFYVGPEHKEKFGRALYSWFSASGGWLFVNALEHILGFQPGFDNFKLDPCFPAVWPGFTLRRVFRGATYEIEVKRDKRLKPREVRLTVDGKRMKNNVVPVHGDGKVHHIKARVGPEH